MRDRTVFVLDCRNSPDIRKEAKDVEHILEDDIRSQIEKKK